VTTSKLTVILKFFSPPEYDEIERSQKSRFLHYTLLIIAFATILLGSQNLEHATHLDEVLFIVSAASLICIPLNKLGYYYPVSAFLYLLLLSVITYSLIDGVGLKDAGMLAYPIFIIFTSFLFNSWVALISTALSIASIYLVYSLETRDLLNPPPYSSDVQLIVISVLLTAAGFSILLVTRNWRRILDNLRQAYDSTLEGWAKALELRDEETEGHSKRVTALAIRVAKKVGVPQDQIPHIRRGALLHDIGKMGIPDEILLKPGSLTDEERRVVEEHPRQARQMLEGIPFLKKALDVPFYHHERWDGSGYPQKLSGTDIPLAARIFAVIDVWDALTSDRPYRPAWTREAAYEYIQENAGVLFDPQCVQAFFEEIDFQTAT